MIDYEWDKRKRAANLEKHRFDFARAIDLFDGRDLLTVPTHSGGHEERFLTIGQLDGVFVTLIWTKRAGKKRFISLRSARREERKEYQKLYS